MALIQWKADLSVNVRQCDERHQRLITLINDLDAAMAEGRSKAMMGAIVGESANYTLTHLATEEHLFARLGYADAPAHAAEHKTFVDAVARFQEDVDAGKPALSIPIITFLSEWLTTHIMGTDKKYSAFLNEKGVT
jgi:hemerythrin-like metal-binding protein